MSFEEDKARDLLTEWLEEIGGCSDGHCIVFWRGGQHTNGGCKCARDPLKLIRVLAAYKDYFVRLDGRAPWIKKKEPSAYEAIKEFFDKAVQAREAE